MHVNTLILGGGLTGLSTAYHLEKQGRTDYLVLEKEAQPGGLCKSLYKKGFTFDCSGHVLHLHTTYAKKLVRELLNGNLQRHQRRAFIYTNTSRVPFPFQANLYALPPAIRKECVDGFLTRKSTCKTPPVNFEDFCLRSFGRGIYRAFMLPYNQKLWGRSPRQLTCEWCGPFVPLPRAEVIRQSAVKKTNSRLGYNAFFYYPKQGGCGALVQALCQHIRRVKTRTAVTQIDLATKKVRAGREIFSYDKLVNTLPLPVFLRLLKKEPALTQQAKKLSSQSVTVYHAAFKGSVSPFSWIYCPDKQDPFFRVGLQSGFSVKNAPKNCYSLYVELPGRVRPGAIRERQILRALVQKGIINKYDEKIVSFFQFLPYSYVIYDKHRTPTVRKLSRVLEKQNCYLAGRYGSWEYSFMEASLLQGRKLAKLL